jgi:hypothetical protein
VYVTVFEPYRDRPFIEAVRALPVRGSADLPVALEVRSGGKAHVVYNRLEGSGGAASALELDDGTEVDARAAVLERTAAGRWEEVYALDGGGAAPVCRTEVASVDYERGLVTLDRPALRQAPAGGIAVVESPGHADAVAVADIVDDRTFSVGGEDLTAATVHITSAQGGRVEFHPKHVWFIQPGMTAVNEAGQVVGRIASVDQGAARVTDGGVSLRSFPDRNRDGQRTCRAMVVGPGDGVSLHYSVRGSPPLH